MAVSGGGRKKIAIATSELKRIQALESANWMMIRCMGWVMTEASGINDLGWIVGGAYNTITEQTYAFLLTPVPEPEIYSMLLVGLGLMGLVGRRKKMHP